MKINIMAEKFGYVTQVIGPVVDVIFEKDGEDLPPIYEALRIERDNGEKLSRLNSISEKILSVVLRWIRPMGCAGA